MKLVCGFVSLVFLAFAGGASAQDLWPYVFPSEDELEQAWREGEISYLQYLRLQQIIVFGIDSLSQHWLDEIPNQDALLLADGRFSTQLDRDQRSPFLNRILRNGRVRYEYAQRVDDDDAVRYRLSCRLEPRPEWRAAVRIHREYAGYERCVYRSISYAPHGLLLKRITLGNFTARFGLGTVVGHRGKILDPQRQLSAESWLTPDYAGFNGFHGVGQVDGVQTDVIVSASRDTSYRHLVIAASAKKASGSWRPMIMVAINRLSQNSSSEIYQDIKIAPGLRYGYQQGIATVELCWQHGHVGKPAVAVMEGRHRFGVAEVRYAGWSYSDSYQNLSGGSRSTNIVREMVLSDIDLGYSDRRSGQAGVYLKAVTLLAHQTKLVTSLVLGSLNSDTTLVQVLTGIEVAASNRTTFRLDYLSRSRRGQSRDAFPSHRRRSRLELHFHTSRLALRSYIAYNTESVSRDFLSWHFRARFDSGRAGKWEGWLNIGRIDHMRWTVEYWYGYVRLEQTIEEWLSTYVKFTHSYRRSSPGSSTMILGVQANW